METPKEGHTSLQLGPSNIALSPPFTQSLARLSQKSPESFGGESPE